jgi:hypothetical protein
LKQLSSFGIIPNGSLFFLISEYNSAFIVAITEVSSSESIKHLIFQNNNSNYVKKVDKAMASSLAMVSALVFNSWPFYRVMAQKTEFR